MRKFKIPKGFFENRESVLDIFRPYKKPTTIEECETPEEIAEVVSDHMIAIVKAQMQAAKEKYEQNLNNNNNMINLAPSKIEEVRLQAFLNCAYQRLFQLQGEIGKMEAELEALPAYTNENEEISGDFKQILSQRVYIASLIGKARKEQDHLTAEINKACLPNEPK